MAKLTDTEKAAITKAATRGAKFATGKGLPPGRRDELLKIAQTLKETNKPAFSKEAIALWAAKIDLAVAKGDKTSVTSLIGPKSVADLTRRPHGNNPAIWDDTTNTNCPCPGPSGW